MKQLKPILHGRDHAPGGPDPIPGGGAGGGALEWEDVGTPGSGFTDPWVRYAIVTATSFASASDLRVVWSTVNKQYSPEGAFVDIAAAGSDPAGHNIRLLKSGFYDVAIRIFSGALLTPYTVNWQIGGGAGAGIPEFGTSIVATQFAGTPTGYPYVQHRTQLTTGATVPQWFRFSTPGPLTGWTGFGAVALITRLST